MEDLSFKILTLASGVGLGLYACKLWEQSLKFQQHKLYVESAVKIVEAIMDKQRQRGVAKDRTRVCL